MRFDIDTYREIADSLVRNKSRSLLTGFGIFWGVFMLLFMLGGGDGLKAMLLKNFEGFATNCIVMAPDETTKPWKGFKEGRTFKMDKTDVERLQMMIPELETVAPTVAAWGNSAVYDIKSTDCILKGVFPNSAKVEEPKLKYGRFINETDCMMERKVCVIGKRIYNDLFPEGGDPCGKKIRIGSIYYTIVGLNMSSGNISIQGRADQAAMIPLPLADKLFHMGGEYDVLGAVARSGVDAKDIEPRIRQIMARKHQYDPTDKQALFVLNTSEIFGIMDNLFRGVEFLILLVGLGTILAGAIGVSNIMMVTVKERTTEIGIRRAIGATPRQILGQIISESIALTVAAGSAGIVFSVLLLRLLEMMTREQGIPFQISFWTAIVAMSLLALLGVAAGLAPALRAMKIKPVDAMRDE